jgi:glycosyltransferase involved in cell wall biosynthesis
VIRLNPTLVVPQNERYFGVIEMNREPSWALVIANCQQEKTIFTCLKLAAEQTYKPKEVIIVDACRHWKRRYERIVSEIFDQYSSIRWVYLTANGRSPARQRHEAIRLTTADVLFLFDDDLLMYPNCAEEIMRIYKADPAGLLPGVQTCLTNLPPSLLGSESAAAKESVQARCKQRFSLADVQNFIGQQLLRIRSKLPRFAPTRPFPDPELPLAVQQLNIAPVKLSQRSCMTYRRQVILDEQFEPLLFQYAMYEDDGVTYQPARHRPTVQALDAKVYRCHGGKKKLASNPNSLPTKTEVHLKNQANRVQGSYTGISPAE